MSIYDRQYMNEDESGGGSGRSAAGTLIFLNIAIWVLWQFAAGNGEETSALATFMSENFTVSFDGVFHHYRIHTLITSALSHVELGHIFWNLLFFWFLADDVERVYGKLNFYWLYVFGAIAASLAHIGSTSMNANGLGSIPMLGASGAIMGIAVVAAIFDPNRPINLFGFITLPLKWLVGLYVLMDLYHALSMHRMGGYGMGAIAYGAHLGGALGGYIFWRLDLRMFRTRGRSEVGYWQRFRRWWKRPRSGRSTSTPSSMDDIPRELPREPVAQRAPTRMAAAASSTRVSGRSQVDAATSARVDEILGKISREGMGALTDEERRFLKESSQKYKK